MNILITGASSGIGFFTAKALSKNEDNNILAIARNVAGLNELEAVAFHKNIKTFSFDLELDDYSDLIQHVKSFLLLSKNDKIDILINNAGYLSKKMFSETCMDDWDKTFKINLFSIVKTIKGLYSDFNRIEGSHIVNIASMGGIEGTRKFPGLASYSASKAAINNLTESLAVEFQNDKIRVNAISPGTVQTKMLNDAFPGIQARTTPEEMGNFIADFAVQSGKLMNGRLIQVSFEG